MPSQRSSAHVAFGNRLRAARRERGMSQDDLAARTGMHRTYVGGIERGERNPSLTNIVRLANALEVEVAELVSDIDDASSA